MIQNYLDKLEKSHEVSKKDFIKEVQSHSAKGTNQLQKYQIRNRFNWVHCSAAENSKTDSK